MSERAPKDSPMIHHFKKALESKVIEEEQPAVVFLFGVCDEAPASIGTSKRTEKVKREQKTVTK